MTRNDGIVVLPILHEKSTKFFRIHQKMYRILMIHKHRPERSMRLRRLTSQVGVAIGEFLIDPDTDFGEMASMNAH
jgi:hypothetical protein